MITMNWTRTHAVARAVRRTVMLLSVALLASCHDSTGLGMAEVRGTWSEQFSIPGASFVLSLDQSGHAVTGSGTYTIEAGPSGTLQVTGTYSAPVLTLSLVYDTGVHRTFTGTLANAFTMRGSFDAQSVTVTFVRH